MAPRIVRISFPGGSGAELAARLDLPAGPARAFALFAHCFTCSKDLQSASRIASKLIESGYGLLRFDFTGLGSSEGEFANTNFSSNVEDLVAAATWLREQYRAPQLLVGHSLGGAAVIVAADQIPEVRAVATIGAPSDSGHAARLFDGALDEIKRDGSADVVLAGRTFTIRQQLIDDLHAGRVGEAAERLKRPLLVMHSPVDNTVGVEHAAAIFERARHPKSFVSLDRADHLLTDPIEAEFAAAMIGAWAGRYLDDESGAAPAPRPTAQVVVAETTQGPFLNHVVAGPHRGLADEPVSVGGFDAGPAPFDFLAMGLGACTSMTLRMYANRKSLPLERVTVEVAHERVPSTEAERAEGAGKQVDQFTRVIQLEGDLDDEARTRLHQIADRCPVHRTLESKARITTSLAERGGARADAVKT